jgi:membrane-associated phospholipid phosphatase
MLVSSFAFAGTNEVILWNQTLLDAAVDALEPPPVIARSLAILSIAQFDAVNSIRHKYKRYAYEGKSDNRNASEEAAVIGASMETIKGLYFARQSAANKIYKRRLTELGDSSAVKLGLRLGAESAKTILKLRQDDGHIEAMFRYESQNRFGEYRDPEGSDAKPPSPGWGSVKPFCLVSGNDFRPSAVDLTGNIFRAAFEDVKTVGGKNSAERTPEQSRVARFWSFGSKTVTPPGAWNQIAGTVIEQKSLPLEKATRLMALLNIALADSAIAAWDAKYWFVIWRPQDAIHFADQDADPRTKGDPTWESYLKTPNHPSYVSGHSTFSSAAATVLAGFFGSDQIKFSYEGDKSQVKTLRSYWSFSSAAREAGRSRVLGGIHFQFDNAAGLELGEKIGKAVLSMELLPTKD